MFSRIRVNELVNSFILVLCLVKIEIQNHGTLKAPYSSKNRQFFIQERFNKLIYIIDKIIKCVI